MISHRTVDEGDKEIADRQDRCQEVGKEDAKMRQHDISMPDDAEGQRLNPLVDMSKLSLGRMKLVQSTSVQMNILSLAKIGVMPVVARMYVLT